jgi:hypothetical protein
MIEKNTRHFPIRNLEDLEEFKLSVKLDIISGFMEVLARIDYISA